MKLFKLFLKFPYIFFHMAMIPNLWNLKNKLWATLGFFVLNAACFFFGAKLWFVCLCMSINSIFIWGQQAPHVTKRVMLWAIHGKNPKEPQICNSWQQYWLEVKTFFEPCSIDHRGEPVFDEGEISKWFLPPNENW